MTLLHVAYIRDNPFSGVCVVVPQHINSQAQHENVGFVNITNEDVGGVKNRFEYQKDFDINRLPEPFNKPDLVIFHEVYRKEYLGMYGNLLKNKIPYVIVPHGELTKEAQHKKRLKKIAANILLFNRFTSKALAIQCLSQKELEATSFGKAKFVGTNGLSLPSEHKTSFSEKGTRILYIGRLDVEVKGLDIMMEAIFQKGDFLREHGCEFYVYGPDLNGRYARVEALIAERNIGDIVHLNHEIMGEDKKQELLKADIFIQTSRSEGMPLGILEAASYGLPVLITEGTRLGDIISEAGAGWVARTDAEAVGNAMEQAVLDRESYAERSQRASSFVREMFAWEKVSGETLSEYRKLITLEKNKRC